jgi:hypothetical protein
MSKRVGKMMEYGATSQQCESPNINITMSVGSVVGGNAAESSEPVVLATPAQPSAFDPAGVLATPSEVDVNCFRRTDVGALPSAAVSGADCEEFDQNPRLRKFHAKRLEEQEFVCDVEFLRNIIKVLIVNHHISITPQDWEDILGVWGDVVVKTTDRRITSRDVEPTCCGTTAKQKEQILTVVKSIMLNGLSLAKHLPAVVSFLGEIGIAL